MIAAVEKESGEQSFEQVAIEIAHQIRRDCGAEGGRQFECHAQANIGGVALQVDRRTRGRGGDHRNQARPDGLANGNVEVQRENRRKQHAASNAGQRAQQAGEKSQDNQQNGHHESTRLPLPTFSMGILILRVVVFWREILVRKRRCRKLRHRPRRCSGLGLFVRVIARPHHRTRLDVAETEAQSLVPQIDEFFRLVEAGDGQMIFRRAADTARR